MAIITEIAGGKQVGRFLPGQSGNPAGKPKGARNRATVAAEALLEGEAEALTRKAIEMALGGDVNALRLCMERLLPPRRDRPMAFDLPVIASPSDVQPALSAILIALANGQISVSEATAVTGLVETYRRTMESENTTPPVMVQIRFVNGVEGRAERNMLAREAFDLVPSHQEDN